VPPEQRHQARYLEDLHARFPMTALVPAVFLSALTGAHLHKLLPAVDRVAQAHAAALPTALLNRLLQQWIQRHPPPSYKGKQPKLFYATQVSTRPPQIAVFTSVPEGMQTAYRQYLEHQLRDAFQS
jgi:GTP-binding protein